MRPGGDADAVRLRYREGHPDAVPDAKALGVRVGQPVRNGDHQRQRDSVSFADRHPDTITVGERKPESLELALS